MKTEKSIEEKANSIEFNAGLIHSNPRLIAEQSFISGYELRQKELEEKTRWIPVEERLPDIRVEDRQVEVMKDTGFIFTVYVSNLEFVNFAKWREIIE